MRIKRLEVPDQITQKVNQLKYTVTISKTDWYDFSEDEKKTTENTVLLVGFLYEMCRVNLVKQQIMRTRLILLIGQLLKSLWNLQEKFIALFNKTKPMNFKESSLI